MMAVGVLIAISVVAVFSAVSPMGTPLRYLLKQLTAIALGGLVLFVLSSLNYQLFRSHPGVLYLLTILVLLAVLIIGRRIHAPRVGS